MTNTHAKLYPSIRKLRSEGYTYSEINETLNVNISKSSLSYICKDIQLSTKQIKRIAELSKTRLIEGRKLAIIANREKFDSKIAFYRESNQGIRDFINDRDAKLIALAMLYLGEGTKWKSHRGPILGSSDPMIVNIYINLLKSCYNIEKSALRCRIQHRSDQDARALIRYWSNATGLKYKQFYPSYADPRTIGKITKKPNYHGVCAIICAGTHIQLELQQIAVIISESLSMGH